MARLPEGAADGSLDATFGLELNEWNGTVEPRLVLRDVLPCAPGPIELAGEPEDPLAAALAEAANDPAKWSQESHQAGSFGVRDRRGVGIAGTLVSLAATGEPV